jgi:thiamine-phosphate pyrophosphorylase
LLDLRLIVVTDVRLAGSRGITEIVRMCLEAGAPAVQLRNKDATARELYEEALVLRRLTSEHDALLFINDRLDVALAAKADGVHLGPDDVPVESARRAASSLLLGFSTDQPAHAAGAAALGADYIGCGAVFGTTSKADVAGERIGLEGLRAVVNAVRIPVVAIGGVDADNASSIAATGAAGVAVLSALMQAAQPDSVVRSILAAFPQPA